MKLSALLHRLLYSSILVMAICLVHPVHAAALPHSPFAVYPASANASQDSAAVETASTHLLDCTAPVRVMPVGDSITKGSGPPISTGYRQSLYTNLRGLGYDVEFVGSRANGGGTPLSFDLDHEGHSGQTADWIADNIADFLDANPADVVLLHIGTNDLLNGAAPADTVADVENILEAITDWERTNDATVVVLLALIINRPGVDATISTYNTLLAEMATARIQNGDGIVLVDMENDTDLDYQPGSFDWADDIHPSYVGYQKMAERWFAAIQSELALPLCLPLRIALSTDTILTSRGADIQFFVTIMNSSDVTATNVMATDSPLFDCNQSLGNLAAGERIDYTCTARHVTEELLNFLTVEATYPDGGNLSNTAVAYVAVTDTYHQYLPFSPRAE